MICGKNFSLKPIVNRFFVGVSSIGLCLIALSAQSKEVVSLNQAIAMSLSQHPDLKVYSHKRTAAQALVEQARVGAPYTMSVVAEDAMGTGNYAGVKSLQTTLSLSWFLENELISSRVQLAQSRTKTALVEQEIKAVAVASDTATTFIVLLSQIEKLKLAELAYQHAQDVLKQIRRKVEAGSLIAVDELRAQATLSNYALEVEDLTHEIEASKAQLAAQWQGDDSFEVSGNLAQIPSKQNLQYALVKLASSPELTRFLVEQKVLQAEIELAKAEQSPAWQITTGIRRNEAVDDFAFTAGISIPLGDDNRNKGAITSLQSKQHQSKAESEALYQRISTQALLLVHKLKHNRHVIDSLSNTSIPLLEKAQAQAYIAYEKGSYRYTDLYAVQQELVNAQSQLIDAYTNIHLFNIELEKLTGTSVSNQERTL